MYYDDIDFYAINKGQSDTKIKIHSVINRWKNETNLDLYGNGNIWISVLLRLYGYDM